jgi:hypothetical protein
VTAVIGTDAVWTVNLSRAEGEPHLSERTTVPPEFMRFSLKIFLV